eukprot:scpid111845/ scgid34209/ 
MCEVLALRVFVMTRRKVIRGLYSLHSLNKGYLLLHVLLYSSLMVHARTTAQLLGEVQETNIHQSLSFHSNMKFDQARLKRVEDHSTANWGKGVLTRPCAALSMITLKKCYHVCKLQFQF